MDTNRQNRIARLLQKELSEMFMLETKKTKGLIVSVTKCYVSSDLSVCRAYLSIFPREQEQETIDNINRNTKRLRYELGTRVRFQLRIIPELRFFLDDSLDYMEHIDELLRQQ